MALTNEQETIVSQLLHYAQRETDAYYRTVAPALLGCMINNYSTVNAVIRDRKIKYVVDSYVSRCEASAKNMFKSLPIFSERIGIPDGFAPMAVQTLATLLYANAGTGYYTSNHGESRPPQFRLKNGYANSPKAFVSLLANTIAVDLFNIWELELLDIDEDINIWT